MLREKKPLPIGTEFFDKLRKNDCYYADKTRLIAELLNSHADVTLFTRPRRLGKTLAMTTLKCFFEIGTDPSLFEGLAISRERELCERHMGRYPVVFVSLKGVDAANFTRAREQMGSVIARAAERVDFLTHSEKLTDEDKDSFRTLRHYSMTEQAMTDSLRTLCRLLEKHYGQKTILLIDEYDVPLQKAFYAGYYDEMAELIRNMFGQALKTNDSLERAVLTGCLRISKESIFTGMNNLQVFTVTDSAFSDCFGFTDAEVRDIMDYYDLTGFYESAREWYDGYRFGEEPIYCPWDMVNYIYDLRFNPGNTPGNFWINSSSNDAVREALAQIETKRYDETFTDDGIEKVLKYGIACCKKRCRVALGMDNGLLAALPIWKLGQPHYFEGAVHLQGSGYAPYFFLFLRSDGNFPFRESSQSWYDLFLHLFPHLFLGQNAVFRCVPECFFDFIMSGFCNTQTLECFFDFEMPAFRNAQISAVTAITGIANSGENLLYFLLCLTHADRKRWNGG